MSVLKKLKTAISTGTVTTFVLTLGCAVVRHGRALDLSLVLVLFAAMRERLEAADVPRPF